VGWLEGAFVMDRRRYPTDLTGAQWARLEPLLVKTGGKTGRPRTHPLREIVNGLLYVLRAGGSWRMMPHDLPPWTSVYGHFRRWKRNGLIERVHDALREQARVAAGRERSPSIAVIDSQSVKATEKGGSAATTPARR
jgi:putative transposase